MPKDNLTDAEKIIAEATQLTTENLKLPPQTIPATPTDSVSTRADSQTSFEVGYVTSTRNYLLLLNGLPTVRINEIIANKDGTRALVTGLQENLIESLLLDDAIVAPNEQFFKTGKQLGVEVGDHLLSRVINPLGLPIDGKMKFPTTNRTAETNKIATGIKSRQFIKTQFITGITTVDMLIPLAHGQRELVMGAARSGKTGFIIDLIVNQGKKSSVVSRQSSESLKADSEASLKTESSSQTIVIYALIGKPLTEIRRLVDILTVNHALEYTCVIAASSSDPASMVLVTPAVAFSVAEYFQSKGRDVLLILDDMGLHAKYYREISLLSNKAPGRESYPGDIFSIHAALVERAGKFKSEYGGGSITCLPVIETPSNDYASFIPTNLMAMTDGHLMFDYEIYHRGFRPAINVALSVSRVGRQTQSIVQKQLADHVKSILAQSKRLETLSRFGSEVSEETRQLLNQGTQIESILAQDNLVSMELPVQIILLGLIFTTFLTSKPADFLEINKSKIIEYLRTHVNLNDFLAKITPLTDEKQLAPLLEPLIPQLEKLTAASPEK
ncbi:hypothetical protein A2631_00670 [Candidatus Daviesbacteria bacterium RIFCSPHIGHO2_01_FULL_44_29]|uniref:ATPase F1/V1/A1 complex alpha/beta subunit nucleotide-binding domain-containing protein n=1 Tax=Candidatus Daviesbacteria bacterium RIFCSPHIGHO2_02_FULL_43_12 TaxID=1797776 RepID=A0A1F5KHL2_9BACT|nr:MAG: hypothetical protein A2631_00670 [Candidatus Daviesbacteria bacterium RIFCSPHIGHO2_01_FULL_44_29]OGE40324.1 MAG: hypothetical protein A3D25_02990 [Candidatus Daviesbacteria bacterium RIFCSPHIGHO2_02_FULL_43_12]OGE69758.1 MAG: hypothetical protein A3B55_02215 [Candidatus Daviesbacteria bacterium RIFCSPLOWO2_01_FULL_43_15]